MDLSQTGKHTFQKPGKAGLVGVEHGQFRLIAPVPEDFSHFSLDSIPLPLGLAQKDEAAHRALALRNPLDAYEQSLHFALPPGATGHRSRPDLRRKSGQARNSEKSAKRQDLIPEGFSRFPVMVKSDKNP